ncbi:hypothetical protein TNCV_4577041 [Trichonephila clavipes]|nr:hypothetical protein TNCV_4577041 [Trichonephila clavipes]
MSKEGAFHHHIIVSFPRQDKRSKGNGCAIQHDFMLLTVSLTSIENFRNNFANIKGEAIWLAKKWGITLESEKKRHRKFRQFFDDFKADEKLQDRERLFDVDVSKANVDVITTQLKNRFETEFKRGRKSLGDDERLGRPNTTTINENITKVHQMVLDDH